MTVEFVLRHTIPAALSLLPAAMDTPEARQMLLAIGLQESGFKHRRQVHGPALGLWQFEPTGFAGVMQHSASAKHAIGVCAALNYATFPGRQFEALADNDVLACCFARLLLWTLPGPLATTADEGWRQYFAAWRPGRPHPETWAGHWETARMAVEGL